MTYSQLMIFARAARIDRLQDYQMRLSIAHNPWRKDHQRFPQKLASMVAREMRGGKKAEVSVAALEGFLGPIKRVQVSRAELAAKLRPKVKPS